MNKLIFATAFALSGTAAFALPAFAQTAESTQSSTVAGAQPIAATQPVAAAQPAANARTVTQAHSVPRVDSRQCIRDTGSHIPPPKGQCLPIAGTSYSQQDLQRTGAIDIGHALQMLDPSITVHGH